MNNPKFEVKKLEIFKLDIVNFMIRETNSILDRNNVENIIFDISTAPKICYIPYLKWMIGDNPSIIENRNLIINYTKPEEYTNDEIESEPLDPYTLIGLPIEDEPIIWFPSLGFKSEFTNKIWENICLLSRDKIIIPVIGFPTYRPDYFDKCIFDHVNTFKENNEFIKVLKNKKYLLCSADDPFDVFQVLRKIQLEHQNRTIILSPIGSKPISLGMSLLAIIYKLSIITIQAKTYNPNYSKGTKSTISYWIYRNNQFTFNI